MVDRATLSSMNKRLERHRLEIRRAINNGRDELRITTFTGRTLMTVSPDHLFDEDGNFFENDLDFIN